MAVAFGRYELLRKLATGGMGQIFLARPQGSPGLSRLLVIKRLLPHLATDRKFLHMFLDEAKIASRLDHANIVRIHELGEVRGSHYLAMDYVAGEDLRTLEQFHATVRGRTIPLGVALRIVADAAAGLSHAHQAKDSKGRHLNLVHRDVSPPNILVGFDGTTKLIDFGVAKAAGRLQETATGFLKGKYPYMSPEQIDALALDPRSDVFSLGVVLWELMTGKRLFKGQNELITARLVSDCSVPPPTRIGKDLPKEVDRLVLKALQRNREQRYPDAAAFQGAIEELLARSPGLAGTRSDVSAFLESLYADRIASEQDEKRQDVLWGALDEERSGATFPGDLRTSPTAGDGDEGPTLEPSLEPQPPPPPRRGPDLQARHTAVAARPPLPKPRSNRRRVAVAVGLAALLAGATAAAALYVQSHRPAATLPP
jgi:serine/threonine protein kinase